jgi:prevent-host-death family protein
MPIKTVDVREAQENLTELLSEVDGGTEVILTQNSTPLARMVPIVSSNTPRVAGLHPGGIWTSDDFDEPLPDEFWLGRPPATLEHLLAGVNEANLQGEVDTGPAMGKEVW